MRNIRLLKGLIIGVISLLVLVHVILSFFFYKEFVFRSNVSFILDISIIFLLLVLGYLKYLLGNVLFISKSYTLWLVLVVLALLTYIVITKKSHIRNVRALSELMEKHNK